MLLTELKINKVLDIENDGLNLAVDNGYLYIRTNKAMYKYNLNNMVLEKENTIFKKEGKARSFSISNNYIFLIDFCDLYLLDKDELTVINIYHIGKDLTSDLVTVRSDNHKAYISMRNGRMVIFDIQTLTYEIIYIGNTSSWEHEIIDDCLLISTIDGRIIKMDKDTNKEIFSKELSKKNIYSILYHNEYIYIASQDMTIKKLTQDTFEVINVAKKAIKGMSKILGIYDNYLITADGQISFFNKDTLVLETRMAFPTGHFNKGVILYNNILIGSDYHSVYMCILD